MRNKIWLQNLIFTDSRGELPVRSLQHSGFSQTHKIGNIGIISNFLFPYICSFLLYLHHMMIVNVTLDITGYK